MSAMQTEAAEHVHPIAAGAAGEMSRWERGRGQLAAKLGRLAHWEFWPAAMVYLPLLPYIAWLALKHRGLGVCTHANPGIPRGGLVGESKWDILQLLPAESIIPTALLGPGPVEPRCDALARVLHDRSWAYPLVLKPDVGERGTGVTLIEGEEAARQYLESQPAAILVQPFHPGPFEAGVFYYRFPDQPHGAIFSITQKRFARVEGDGSSSIEMLIRRHTRYRMQLGAYLAHLGERARQVPGRGESVRIGFAGNHCRGAMFLDGEHLITPAIVEAFDAIALRTPGFYFGRFDVRYSDEHEFAAGRGFQVVELNGLLSESTNIYDPAMRFWKAQRLLREQWRIAFEIGACNVRMSRGSDVRAAQR